MTRNLHKLFLLSAVIGLASCAENKIDLNNNPSNVIGEEDDTIVSVTMTAIASGGSANAVIDDGATDGTHPLFWSAGDKVGVYFTNPTYVAGKVENQMPFDLVAGEGTAHGTFSGLTSKCQCEFYALQPYQELTSFDGNSTIKNVALPTEQTAVNTTCNPRVAMMMGYAKQEELKQSEGAYSIEDMYFRNILSYLRVKPKFDCKSITIISNREDEYLTGVVDVSFNNAQPKCTPVMKDGKLLVTNRVVLTGADGGDLKAGETYYIGVLPVTWTQGIKIIYETCEKVAQYTYSKAIITLKRNNYHDFTSLLPNSLEVVPAEDRMAFVDLGLTSGTKWGTRNLGANHTYTSGKYYAWGEVAAMGEDDMSNIPNRANYFTSSKLYYDWDSYKYGKGSQMGYDFENMKKYTYDDGKVTLETQDDPVLAKHCEGEMPTKEQFDELVAECDWEYVTDYKGKGAKGFIVYNKSDHSKFIFLPFTGFVQGTGVIEQNTTHGYYWSKTLNPTNNCLEAYDLLIGFDEGDKGAYRQVQSDRRRGGQCIRPVLNP